MRNNSSPTTSGITPLAWEQHFRFAASCFSRFTALLDMQNATALVSRRSIRRPWLIIVSPFVVMSKLFIIEPPRFWGCMQNFSGPWTCLDASPLLSHKSLSSNTLRFTAASDAMIRSAAAMTSGVNAMVGRKCIYGLLSKLLSNQTLHAPSKSNQHIIYAARGLHSMHAANMALMYIQTMQPTWARVPISCSSAG